MALALDKLRGKDVWKTNPKSGLYDWEGIQTRIHHMKSLRIRKDIKGLLQCLRSDLRKNIGGISNPILYNQCSTGTKQLIEDYHTEVINCIQTIYYYKGSQISIQNKIEFFTSTSQSFGRTALLLSGGASLGKFHFGVIKALYEQDLLPRVIAGSSAGSLTAAILCSFKFSELQNLFNDFDCIKKTPMLKQFWARKSILDALRLIIQGKPMLCQDTLKKAITKFLGDMTFLEVFEQNKWNLNVSVTMGSLNSESKLLNYLTAPNVVIWSAVLASCAIPGMFKQVELMKKDKDGKLEKYMNKYTFIDGSVSSDLPTKRLSELFNINTFIVSQVNPHVAPFISSGGFGNPRSRNQRKILEFIKGFYGNELNHWVRQIIDLNILPKQLKDVPMLFVQNYIGHVTIAPSLQLNDIFFKCIYDVPEDEWDPAIQMTYIYTLQRMSHIRSIYGIEREFERYFNRLKQKLKISNNLTKDKEDIKNQIHKTLIYQSYDPFSGKLKIEALENDNNHLNLEVDIQNYNYKIQDVLLNPQENTKIKNMRKPSQQSLNSMRYNFDQKKKKFSYISMVSVDSQNVLQSSGRNHSMHDFSIQGSSENLI